jgi:hypothetical protein
MKRPRPNTKSMLSASWMVSQENLEDDMLQEMAHAEDMDPFFAELEIRHVHFLLEYARSKAGRGGKKKNATGRPNTDQVFFAWHRRKDGIAGIRSFVAERLQHCESLLRPPREERGSSTAAGGPPLPPSVLPGSQHHLLNEIDHHDIASDKCSLATLALRLGQLDEFLTVLETSKSNDSKATQHGPDLAACVGSAISFGLAIGYLSAKSLFREVLERDATTQAKRTQGGDMGSWQLAHLPEAAQLISQVLHRVLKEGKGWQDACAHAGVGGGAHLPSVDTMRRMIYREIGTLLGEIQSVVDERRLSVTDACRSVAAARNRQGYKFTPELLEELCDRHRKGKLPGPHRNWLDQLASGRVSKELQDFLWATEREHRLSSGNVIDAALDTYREPE